MVDKKVIDLQVKNFFIYHFFDLWVKKVNFLHGLLNIKVEINKNYGIIIIYKEVELCHK